MALLLAAGAVVVRTLGELRHPAAGHLAWWMVAGCGALIAAIGLLTTMPRAVASAARVAARFPTEPTPSAGPAYSAASDGSTSSVGSADVPADVPAGASGRGLDPAEPTAAGQ